MRRITGWIFLLFIIIVVGAYLYIAPYLSTSFHEEATEVLVPEGVSLNYVADLLLEKNIIKNKIWFKYRAKKEGVDRKIKPGSYLIDTGLDLDDIFQLLEKGVPETPLVVTIPEGFTLYQIANRIEKAGLGPAEEFIQETEALYEKKGLDFDTYDLHYRMEGYLYPETYHFNKKQGLDEIVATMADTMEGVFTEEYRQRAEEMGLSLHELLTIASLIEREAYNDEERATIAGVIYNRLAIDMILQIDATVIYGVGKGQEHIKRVLTIHLKDDSPFNTYRHKGLPPGPIASPSKASIHASLYPDKHDYLYYVMGEDGHVFNQYYEDHLEADAKYKKRINKE